MLSPSPSSSPSSPSSSSPPLPLLFLLIGISNANHFVSCRDHGQFHMGHPCRRRQGGPQLASSAIHARSRVNDHARRPAAPVDRPVDGPVDGQWSINGLWGPRRGAVVGGLSRMGFPDEAVVVKHHAAAAWPGQDCSGRWNRDQYVLDLCFRQIGCMREALDGCVSFCLLMYK